jgi:hypothetical protein
LSRCDFPAVISAQKKSAETVCPCGSLVICSKLISYQLIR